MIRIPLDKYCVASSHDYLNDSSSEKKALSNLAPAIDYLVESIDEDDPVWPMLPHPSFRIRRTEQQGLIALMLHQVPVPSDLEEMIAIRIELYLELLHALLPTGQRVYVFRPS